MAFPSESQGCAFQAAVFVDESISRLVRVYMKTVALNVLAAGPECWRAPEKDSPNFSVREGDLNAKRSTS
jgi:hypothetical protein